MELGRKVAVICTLCLSSCQLLQWHIKWLILTLLIQVLLIIMYIYHALINALSAHLIHINLNMIFYTHVEHSPTKTIYVKYYTKQNKNALQTHTHTCTRARTHTHTHIVAETGYWYCLLYTSPSPRDFG